MPTFIVTFYVITHGDIRKDAKNKFEERKRSNLIFMKDLILTETYKKPKRIVDLKEWFVLGSNRFQNISDFTFYRIL